MLNSLAEAFHPKKLHQKLKKSTASWANLDPQIEKSFGSIPGFRKLKQKLKPQNG